MHLCFFSYWICLTHSITLSHLRQCKDAECCSKQILKPSKHLFNIFFVLSHFYPSETSDLCYETWHFWMNLLSSHCIVSTEVSVLSMFLDKLCSGFFFHKESTWVSATQQLLGRAGWIILSTYETSPTTWIMLLTGPCKYKCHLLTNLCFDSSRC